MLFRPCGKPDGAGRRNAFNAGPVLHQPEDFIPGQHHVTMKHPHDAGDGIGGPQRNGQYRTTGPSPFPAWKTIRGTYTFLASPLQSRCFTRLPATLPGTARSGQILYMNRRKAVFSIPRKPLQHGLHHKQHDRPHINGRQHHGGATQEEPVSTGQYHPSELGFRMPPRPPRIQQKKHSRSG